MKIKKITPRGYCHGVVNALQEVAKTINNDELQKPIYILGEIVHNKIITEEFSKKGVITLTGDTRENLLEKIDKGTIIITAHGASHKVFKKAKQKGLDIIDATCIDVYKTHNLISDKIDAGYDIIYIGKQNHPEPEGVLAINPNKIHLISNMEDLDNLNLDNNNLLITNQTTMSLWDTIKLIEKAKEKYPSIEIENEICLSTQQRQEAVLSNCEDIDLLIVVGDPNSNNTNRLAQISKDYANTKALRVESLDYLDISILMDNEINIVGVTSGASTPTLITTQLIKFIERFDRNNPETWKKNIEINKERIIPRVK